MQQLHTLLVPLCKKPHFMHLNPCQQALALQIFCALECVVIFLIATSGFTKHLSRFILHSRELSIWLPDGVILHLHSPVAQIQSIKKSLQNGWRLFWRLQNGCIPQEIANY